MRKLTYKNALGASIVLYDDLFLITKLDGIDMAGVDMQTQKAPYQDGLSDIDAIFQARTVVVEGAIVNVRSLPSIWTNRAAILAALNPKLGIGTLSFQDNNETLTTPARAIVVNLPNKLTTEPFQLFHIQFFCPDPYWYGPTNNAQTARIVTGGFTFPFSFPMTFGVFTGNTPAVCLNAGDSTCPVILTITGPSVNPVVTNLTTSQLIKCNLVLNPGDVLVINTKFGSKSVTKISGATTTNQAGSLDSTSSFWQLAVGSNSIQFVDSTLNGTENCQINWYNRFVGK